MRASVAKLALAAALVALAVPAVQWSVVRPIVDVSLHRACNDFDTFFFGAKAVHQHDRSYYDHAFVAWLAANEADRHSIPAIVAPPFTVVPFVPLTTLPYKAARIVWHLVTLAFYGAALALMDRALGGARNRRFRIALWTFGLLTLATYEPLHFHFCHGQTNILMLLCVAAASASAVSTARWRHAGAGAAAALGVLGKVFPGIVLPALAAYGGWRALAWAAAAMVALALAAAPIIGLTDVLAYPEHLRASFFFGGGADVINNVAMKRLLLEMPRLLGYDAAWVRDLIAVLAATPLMWIFYRIWCERPDALAFQLRLWQACSLIGLLMASYWEYHMVLSLGAYAVLLRLAFAEGSDWRRWQGPLAAASVCYVLASAPAHEVVEHGEWALVVMRNVSLIGLALVMEWCAIRRRSVDQGRVDGGSPPLALEPAS